jgi:hypothetical protein
LAKSLLPHRVLPTFRDTTFAIRPILRRPAALTGRTVVLGNWGFVIAQPGAPFTRFAVARESDMTENLSTFVAGFSDVHAVLI